MRLCARYAPPADDGENSIQSHMSLPLEDVFGLVRDIKPDRTLLFGSAAAALVQDRLLQEGADDAFVDEAAQYLLGKQSGDVPSRQGHSFDEFSENLVCVASLFSETSKESPRRLVLTDRAVEMEGKTIVMALPNVLQVESEDLSNAQVWIGGGQRRLPGEELPPILALGNIFDDEGGMMVVDIDPRVIIIRWIGKDKKEQERFVFPFRAKNKMSVQG
ncbi:MAG: hypothetical protein GY822_03030 [Deltaproteobacteria bacterium]|nr:hypothetical protein [Deltaproteobacteria bacterium]